MSNLNSLLVQIWKKLLTKNIIDLRFGEYFSESWLIDLLVEFLSSRNLYSKNKLRDLELKLSDPKDVIRIFQALNDNYMIKTLTIETMMPVDFETMQLAEKFKAKSAAL